MRKEFNLPKEDTEYLDSSGHSWETINGSGRWLLIHDYPIPQGYNVHSASIALRIDNGYPVSQIDMVFFSPHLAKADGSMIKALAMANIDGRQWQRWSRHRTGGNPWRPGIDSLGTHVSLVDYWLERELN